MCLSATILVTAATSIGGAGCGWVVERNADLVRDRFLGGMICGFLGGVFLLFSAMWRVMRRVVVNEVLNDQEHIDIGATLFWATVAGAILFGSVGAALGFAMKGGWRLDVFGCAIAAGSLSLIPARMLKNAAQQTSRTRSDSAVSRKWD
jgi:hypothetical protein